MAQRDSRFLTERYGPNIKRSVIVWSLPKVEALKSYDFYNSDNIKSSGDRIYVKMYVNPESVTITDGKMINETLTKGGYVIQYWGEKNTTIGFNGTTGSSGIEGINILNKVYRHEQYEFENLIKSRVSAAKDRIKASVVENAAKLNQIQSGPQLSLVPNALSDGLETIMDVFSGNKGSVDDRQWEPISTRESLGSLATTIEMHYDGLIYQGYFTSFSFTETAQSPGIFNYTTNFTVLRKEGIRSNYMPWHRSPYDSNGSPRPASAPKESYVTWNLTFPYSNSEYFREIEVKSPMSELRDAAQIPSGFNPVSRK